MLEPTLDPGHEYIDQVGVRRRFERTSR